MPVVSLELPQSLLDRLQQVAAGRSVPLEAVAHQILALHAETDDSPLPHPDSFRPPKRPAKFDRAKVEALLADLEEIKRRFAGSTTAAVTKPAPSRE